MKYIFPFLFLAVSCTSGGPASKTASQPSEIEITPPSVQDRLELVQYYEMNKGDSLPSKSKGSVSKGSLEHGKLLPFYGKNYTYFDRDSYLGDRAFTSDVVRDIIAETYASLDELHPRRQFYLMELSNKKGGKIAPHRTHQNGLSADFMMPKLKDGQPDYSLDTLGKAHYFLDFNDDGAYLKDTSIKIDFDLIAEHILLLNENARSRGYKIGKVIIKIEYKDELFSSAHGKKLKESGIYIVQGLSDLINDIHDDHFHIDFEKL